MKKLLIALFLISLMYGAAEGAKNYLSPLDCPWSGHSTCDGKDQNQDGTADDGAGQAINPAFKTVADGYAAFIKDADSAGYTAQSDDTVSTSGVYLNKATGYRTGGIFVPGTFTNGSYYVWLLVRTTGSPTNSDKVVWWGTDADVPTKRSFDNSRAAYLSGVTSSFCSAPQTRTGCNWIGPLPVGLDFTTINSTQSHSTDPATVTLNGDGGIWLTAGPLVEFDAIYVSTNVSATPVFPETSPEVPPAQPNGIGGANVTELQFTYKTVGSGTNRLLVCGIGGRTATATVSSVTSSVDGAFTLVQSDNNSGATTVRSYLYKLVNPTSGDHVITASFSSAQNAAILCADFEDVDQTTPLSAVTKGEGDGDASTNIASATDELVLDVFVPAQPHSEIATVGAGQTSKGSSSAGIEGQSNRKVFMSTETGAATTTMSWTQTGSSNDYVHQLVAIKPVTGGGDPPPVPANYILNKTFEDSSLTSGSVSLAGCSPGGHVISTSPVRTGAKSGLARLVTSWTSASSECADSTFLSGFPGHLVRGEYDRFSVGPAHDVERWYGFTVNIDAGWTYASGGSNRTVISQWHTNTDACDVAKSPHLSISISVDGNWLVRNIWDAAACTTQNPPANDSDSGETIWTIGPVIKGVWVDWVVHAKWSYNTDGILEVWQQVNGGGYVKVVDKSGRNTYNDQNPEFHNVGIYHAGYSVTTPNPPHDQKATYDNWRITDETGCFDAVDPSVASPAGC